MSSIAVSFYREPEPIVEEKADVGAYMQVFGIGGGGGNTVTRMIESGVSGVEFVVLNTDKQALHVNLAPIKIQLGESGRGAGADSQVGRKSAEQSVKEIEQLLVDTELLFLTIGMGGGTGTGAGPVIAQIVRKVNKDILIVAIVTKPFIFEGANRMAVAERGIEELSQFVDTLVVIPNEKLLNDDDDLTVEETWLLADNVVAEATRGISGLISVPGQINADLNDVRTVMRGGGRAVLGIGRASGENRGAVAAQRAIDCPLVEHVSMAGAKKVLLGVTYPPGEKMRELKRAGEVIQQEAGGAADVIFGTAIDKNVGDEIVVTVIATGLGYNGESPDETQLEIELHETDLATESPSGNGDGTQAENPEVETVEVVEPELVVIEPEPQPHTQFTEPTLQVVSVTDPEPSGIHGEDSRVEWDDLQPQQGDLIAIEEDPAAAVSESETATEAVGVSEQIDAEQSDAAVSRQIEYSYRTLFESHQEGRSQLTQEEFDKIDLSEPAYDRYFSE